MHCSIAAIDGRSDQRSVLTCTVALETETLSFRDRARTFVNRGVLQMRQRDFPTARADFEAERARHEKIKADEREFEFAVKKGEYLPRDIQRQAAATAIAVLTQSLRSIPDNLERSLGLAPETVEAVAIQIDEALAEVAAAFKAMTNDV